MSSETTRVTMMAYLQALTDRSALGPYFAPDVLFSVMGSDQRIRGAEAVEQFIVWLHTQAFDARPEFKGPFITDNHATLEAEFVGRHIGEFFGVPASYHDVRVPYAVVYDLVGDRITALRFYMPMNVLMEQISMAASPVGATA